MQVESEHDPTPKQSVLPALISLNAHLILFLLLALWAYSADERQKPVILQLSNTDEESPTTTLDIFDVEVTEPEPVLEETLESIAIDPLTESIEPIEVGELAEIAPPVEGTGSAETLVSLKGLPGAFADKVRDAQANGIEIVIVFDATGSMGSELAVVKSRIDKICEIVLEKIPSARFSLVAYRDRGSNLVEGIALGNDRDKVTNFINRVVAAGGGDRPEALDAGMNWAIKNNDFRNDSQKVMLIFGDAPPHSHKLNDCNLMARKFNNYDKGIVHTVTCKSSVPLPEFYEIASAGRGRAYTMTNSQHLMEELLVLAFGREHRNAVIKFFNLKLQQGMRSRPKSNRSARPSRRRS